MTDTAEHLDVMVMANADLKDENKQLREALGVFFKVVVVDGKQHRPGYPLCAGCPHLTIARGWECFYKRQTTECKYPDELKKAALALVDDSSSPTR